MHEILTLQLGREANYLGTHFWNAQESYFTYSDLENSPVDHDIHFRAGIGTDGSETYTPRAVIYDFKSNFGTLKRINELYEVLGDAKDAQIWTGQTITHRQPPVAPSRYQEALVQGADPEPLTTSNVRYWSDYARTFYHPRSVVQIYETELNPGQRSFDDYTSGTELFRALDREEDLVDRDIRPFAEECDQMQGLQMLTGVENAWAGFATRYLDQLRDEFGKLPIWIWGVGEPAGSSLERRGTKIVNQARAVYELSSQASMYVPMSGSPAKLPSYTAMDERHLWHTSAMQMTAFESVMLPTRLKALQDGTSAVLDHLAIALGGGEDRRIAKLSLALGDEVKATRLPDRNANGATLDTVPRTESPRDRCELFPAFRSEQQTKADNVFAQVDCQRGDNITDDDEDVEMEDVRMERDDGSDGRRLLKFETRLAMPLPTSFPPIYEVHNATSVAVSSSLNTSSSIGDWARSLELASRMRTGLDEREELSDGLKTISEAYASGFSSDEEGEWDD